MKRLVLVLITVVSLPFFPANLFSAERVAKIPLGEWTAVADRKGWFKEEFAKCGAKVEIVPLNSAASMALPSLFERGDIHFFVRHLYPLLQQRINGMDATVIWQSVNVTPRCATVVVLKDSPIKTLEDLRGKTLATSRFGCPYFASLELLKGHGLILDSDTNKGDVRYLNITSAEGMMTGFISGKFEALAIHPAYKNTSTRYIEGLVREIGSALPGGVYLSGGGRTSIVVPRQWGKDNPDLLKAYLTVFAKTRLWILAHPDEAVPIVAEELRITKQVAEFLLKDDSSFTLLPGIPSSQDAVQTFKWFQEWAIKNNDDFYTKKSLTDKQLDGFVDKRFFEGGEFYVDTSDPKDKKVTEVIPAKPQLAQTQH